MAPKGSDEVLAKDRQDEAWIKVGVPGLTDTDERDGGRRLRCLPQRDAAVHGDPLTGNVPGSVAGQERRELPDVLQGLLSSQRH